MKFTCEVEKQFALGAGVAWRHGFEVSIIVGPLVIVWERAK